MTDETLLRRAPSGDSSPAPAQLRGRSSAIGRRWWLKWLLIAIVVSYVGVIVLAPLIGLVAGAFSGGLEPIIEALSRPDVLSAFWRTIMTSLVVVLIHAIFGTMVAWVLVRQDFR